MSTLCDEINEGKIQYAFVRVLDPNTNLVKFLLVNFQGEAVLDLVFKGTCSNHIKDITKLLKNHLTITASTLDDLDEDLILSKLSKITSAYDFQTRAVPNDERITIGTNYTKVVPTKEIDSVKRDEFWKQEERVEKERVAVEMEAKRLANLKIEEERLKREQMEHAKREQFNKAQDAKTPVVKPAKVEIHHVKPIEADQNVTKPRAEEMRFERRKEAQELIGNKVNAAKMMFQQQAAQSVAVKSAGPPVKPIRKTIHKIEPEPAQISTKDTEISQTVESIEPEEVVHEVSTIKRSPKSPTTPEQQINAFIEPESNGTNKIEECEPIVHEQVETIVQETAIQPQMEEPEPQDLTEDVGDQPMLKAVALYDYQAVDDTEISFDPGDLITHIDTIDAGMHA